MSRFLLIQLYPAKGGRGKGERGTFITATIFMVVAYSFSMAEK